MLIQLILVQSDYVLYISPPSASHRLLVALRLIHAHTHGNVAARDGWEQMIKGESEIVSHDNELRVRSSLASIARAILGRAKVATGELKNLARPAGGEDVEDWFVALERVNVFWYQEEKAAREMLKNLDAERTLAR